MSSSFGDLVRQHLSRKHGLSQNKLADGINQDPSVISRMCKGQRLTGPLARERVLEIIRWFHAQGVLSSLNEANALLEAAGMARLNEKDSSDASVIRLLPPLPTPSQEKHPPPFLAPRQPSYRLVGRERFIRQLKNRLFAHGSVALSALNGLPGVGKTALAIALAHDPEVQSHFRDGILWAALGRDPDVLSILGTWALALGFRSEEIAQRNTIKDRQLLLRTALGNRRVLLVIDDAWQSEAALAFKIGGPYCAHLLTTRQPGIAVDFAREGIAKVSELNIEEGLTLLAKLAPEAVASEPETARELVAAVGGLPLAIILMGRYLRREMASGQPRRLHQALQRLRDTHARLKIEQPPALIGEMPAYPNHVPLSLQAAITLSAETLSAEARQALQALALFPPKPNTFSEEAATAAIGGRVALLDELYDAGLLESAGEDRYTLHQTIADYGRAGEIDPVACRRMVAYFVDYAQKHEHDHDLLGLEQENILAALQWAFSLKLHSQAVQGVNAIAHFLEARGLYALAETYLRRARQAAMAVGDWSGLAMTLLHNGRIQLWRGDYAQAEAEFRQGLARIQRSEHPVVSSFLLGNLGWLAMHRGEYDSAEECYKEALALARQADHRERICSLLANLGVLAFQLGNDQKAEALFQESLSIARQINHRERISDLLLNLGTVKQRQGEHEQAEALYLESLTIAQELGHRENICFLLSHLGTVSAHLGRYGLAEMYHRQGLKLARQIDSRWLLCHALVEWGEYLLERGRWDQSEAVLQEAAEMAHGTDMQEFAAQCAKGLARIAQARSAAAEDTA